MISNLFSEDHSRGAATPHAAFVSLFAQRNEAKKVRPNSLPAGGGFPPLQGFKARSQNSV
jgi:hypothetical protein